jgi:hypothetical protein
MARPYPHGPPKLFQADLDLRLWWYDRYRDRDEAILTDLGAKETNADSGICKRPWPFARTGFHSAMLSRISVMPIEGDVIPDAFDLLDLVDGAFGR